MDVLVRFSERGIDGDTLQKLHNKFAGRGTSQTCCLYMFRPRQMKLTVKYLFLYYLKTA